jgi:adenosylcobinamide-GDP ribazoletransferase
MTDPADSIGADGRQAWLRQAAVDLGIALQFATRLPLRRLGSITGSDLARASWALPLAGALIGVLAALVFGLARHYGLAPLIASALAVTASLALTGCLHEDGLADTCDGFGGGHDQARKLEIMRDSRIGTYGACALILSLLLRVGALASFSDASQATSGAIWALIAAHAAARAVLPAFLRWVPSARADGLSADAGRPPSGSVLAAALIGAVLLLVCLGAGRSFAALVMLLIAFLVMRWLCLKQIGGQTGDTTGALEQINEIAILLAAASGA